MHEERRGTDLSHLPTRSNSSEKYLLLCRGTRPHWCWVPCVVRCPPFASFTLLCFLVGLSMCPSMSPPTKLRDGWGCTVGVDAPWAVRRRVSKCRSHVLRSHEEKERTRSYAIILIKMVAREVEEGGEATRPRLLVCCHHPPYLRKAAQGRAVLWHMGRFTAKGT